MPERFLKSSDNSKIYEIVDIQLKKQEPLIAKIQESNSIFLKEIETIKRIEDRLFYMANDLKQLGTVPKMKASGHLVLLDSKSINYSTKDCKIGKDNAKIYSYIIMPKCGVSVQQLFYLNCNQFPAKSIYSLGI